MEQRRSRLHVAPRSPKMQRWTSARKRADSVSLECSITRDHSRRATREWATSSVWPTWKPGRREGDAGKTANVRNGDGRAMKAKLKGDE